MPMLPALAILAPLALLGVAAAPFVVPGDASPAATAQPVSPFACSSMPWDAQNDGHAETWSVCSTPQCGCMCPYAGAAIVVDAAGQQRGAFVVVSCQSGYGTTSGPSDGGSPVTVIPIVGGGALGGP